MWKEFIEWIKNILGIASEFNLTTPRMCLSAFIRSIDKCDINEDGLINSKELLKLYKDTSVKSVTGYEMTNEEIYTFLEDYLKRV